MQPEHLPFLENHDSRSSPVSATRLSAQPLPLLRPAYNAPSSGCLQLSRQWRTAVMVNTPTPPRAGILQ